MSEPQYRPMQESKTSKLAITSLILILLGPLPAIICGHIALSFIKRSNGALKGKELAIAAIALGYVSLLAIVVAFCIPILMKG